MKTIKALVPIQLFLMVVFALSAVIILTGVWGVGTKRFDREPKGSTLNG